MRRENALYYAILLATALAIGGALTAAARHATPAPAGQAAAPSDQNEPLLRVPDILELLAAEKAPDPDPPLVREARKLLGAEYRLGGRQSRTNPGLDCMGLVFLSWSAVTKKNWRDLSVNGTKIIADRELGPSVPGLDGVLADRFDVHLLEPGDVVFLLGEAENDREPPAKVIDSVGYWIWHMGVYSGAGRWINADNYTGKTIEVDLAGYLKQHADFLAGVWAVRPQLGDAKAEEKPGQEMVRIRTRTERNAVWDISEERVRFEGGRNMIRETPVPPELPPWPDVMKERGIPENAERKIVVSKAKHTLTLLAGGQVVGEFLVGFGSNPINDKLNAGDRCTPEGLFRIAAKNASSEYHKSLCLNYPTAETFAKRNRAQKLGLSVGGSPGANICIHGSKPHPTVQRVGARRYLLNWTWGCIALNNDAMDQVFEFAQVGQGVEIARGDTVE